VQFKLQVNHSKIITKINIRSPSDYSLALPQAFVFILCVAYCLNVFQFSQKPGNADPRHSHALY
jgi:hypothetical protein